MLKVLQRYAPEFLVYPDKLFDKDDHSLVIQEWDGILVQVNFMALWRERFIPITVEVLSNAACLSYR